MSAPHIPTVRVRKRDGSLEPYDGYEISQSISAAARGLEEAIERTTQLCSELEIVLFDQITTEQLDEAVIQVALQNVKDDPAYDTIAARLLIKTLYKQVFGQTHDLFGEASADTLALLHRNSFPATSNGASTPGCWTCGCASGSTWSDLPRRSTRPGTTCCATSACRPCGPATCSPTPTVAPWRFPSSSGCVWPWGWR